MRRHPVFLLKVFAVLLLTFPFPARGIELIRYEITYNDTSTPYVLDRMTVAPNVPYANTGLSYHPEEHYLFSSTYCSEISAWIEKINKDNSSAGDCLSVLPPVNQIQGLAFDISDSTFWVWGRNSSSQGIIFHLDYQGIELGDNIPINMYGGSLEYDRTNDHLWAKPYSPNQSIVYIYDLESLSLIDQFNTGVNGEGVAIDPFDEETYWIADELWIYQKIRGTSAVIGIYPNPSDSSHYQSVPPDTFRGQAEGLIVDPSDRTLWFNADQSFHGNRPDGNLCWHMDPLNCYGEKMHIPGGMIWSKGRTHRTTVNNNRLQLSTAHYEGSFISPIVDFLEYTPTEDSTVTFGLGQVLIHYRGSDTAPTTNSEPSQLCLDYWDANNQNDGWGAIQPGGWSVLIPDYRYIQMKLTLIAPCCEIELQPLGGPIVIPGSGGSFDYGIMLSNIVENTIVVDVWIEAIIPTGTLVSPLVLRSGISLSTGASLLRTLTQAVPATAPGGTYEYLAKAGIYPEFFYADESFTFVKMDDDDLPGEINTWSLYGWEDETTVTSISPNLSLNSARPNPFNASTVISYQLSVNSYANLTIYDLSGRKVTELFNGWRDVGTHELTFDAAYLPSGVYFARLTATNFQQIQKLLLLK
jgi:hypothetical protein